MQNLNPKAHIIPIDLLSNFMRAMALGASCAGLLLFYQEIDLASVITVPEQWLATLIFLLSIGIAFRLGVHLRKLCQT